MTKREKRPAIADRLHHLSSKLAAGIFTLVVVVQYVRIIDRNIVVAWQVRDHEAVIRQLRSATEEQQRHIARLERGDGAIPEIHDRLRLVAPGEAIVYLRHDDGSSRLFAPAL
jgi:hypothetical protein